METRMNPRLPQFTRWLVYLFMAIIVVAVAALALAGIALPIYWTDIAREVASEYPKLDFAALLPWMLTVFALGIASLGIVWAILRKLLAIINSVEAGDPFNAANSGRLTGIGWLMVAGQLLGFPLAFAASRLADFFGDNDVGTDLPLNGVLAILLVFILADLFKRAAAMREELEGTV